MIGRHTTSVHQSFLRLRNMSSHLVFSTCVPVLFFHVQCPSIAGSGLLFLLVVGRVLHILELGLSSLLAVGGETVAPLETRPRRHMRGQTQKRMRAHAIQNTSNGRKEIHSQFGVQFFVANHPESHQLWGVQPFSHRYHAVVPARCALCSQHVGAPGGGRWSVEISPELGRSFMGQHRETPAATTRPTVSSGLSFLLWPFMVHPYRFLGCFVVLGEHLSSHVRYFSCCRAASLSRVAAVNDCPRQTLARRA